MSNSNKTYHQVLGYLIEQIKNGTINKGSRVPTERELAELLEVSRAAIREALGMLEIIGLLEKIPGQGTFIKDEIDTWSLEPMSIIFKLSGTGQNEVYEFRKMIEVEMATLAAQKITDEEIIELKRCYCDMESATEELEKAKFDKEFHKIIAKASKNHIILNSYNAMSNMLDLFTVGIRSAVLLKEDVGIIDKLHKDILDAIVSKNKKDASKFMGLHMDKISKYF